MERFYAPVRGWLWASRDCILSSKVGLGRAVTASPTEVGLGQIRTASPVRGLPRASQNSHLRLASDESKLRFCS
jgi:hypothetical protein